jgi:DNA (cytosine-5)-methyltransferase 1
MLRIIREVQPKWVVGENVLGLVNWSGGLVFDEVQADLESEGYEIQPYVLPAASVNAPHKRDRVWFVAYSDHKGRNCGFGQIQETNGEIPKRHNDSEPCNTSIEQIHTKQPITKHPNCIRQERRMHSDKREITIRKQLSERDARSTKPTSWENFPTKSPICTGNDGLPTELDGITFSKWRNESIKAGGNAIVPQVVYQIFKAINEYKTNIQKP